MNSPEFDIHYHEMAFQLACHERTGADFQPAFTLFNQHSLALYDSPGRLIIEPKAGTGYKLDYRIDRKGSEAVGHMVVFCYDLMLARTWAALPAGPGFPIHDSTLFDGADERQFTQALHLASLTSQNENFQYLCCLNSDRIPTSGFPDSFDWRNFVKLTLRDGSPDGGCSGSDLGRVREEHAETRETHLKHRRSTTGNRQSIRKSLCRPACLDCPRGRRNRSRRRLPASASPPRPLGRIQERLSGAGGAYPFGRPV